MSIHQPKGSQTQQHSAELSTLQTMHLLKQVTVIRHTGREGTRPPSGNIPPRHAMNVYRKKLPYKESPRSLHRPKVPTPDAASCRCGNFCRAMQIPRCCRRSPSSDGPSAFAHGSRACLHKPAWGNYTSLVKSSTLHGSSRQASLEGKLYR